MADGGEDMTEEGDKYGDGVNRNARLIVRNISFKATDESLREHFAPHGELVEAQLLRKPDGRLVGCGFVHYKHVPMANAAIAATHKKPFMGRPVYVAFSVPKNKYEETLTQRKDKVTKNKTKTAAPEEEAEGNTQVEEEKEPKAKEEKDKPERLNRAARLIVRNISFKATEASLREHFEPYGFIHEVKLLKKPDGKLVGCAFIHYKNVLMAQKALLNTNMKPFLGRPVSVDWAVAKDKYMQFVDQQQLELQERVKKEAGSDEDGDGESADEKTDVGELKEEVKSESDDDGDENDEDADEDDDEEDDEDEDMVEEDQSESGAAVERKRIQLNDAEDGCTVFITNIPFSVDNEQLKNFAQQTGPVLYALICVDPMTEHSRGTGFVKFQNKEDAERFLSLGPESLGLEGQALQPRAALRRDSLRGDRGKQPKDTRNLYLVKEGVVVAGTKAAVAVSASDMAKRLALERSKTQMLKNLNRFVSRYRLVVSNLPPSCEDGRLRALAQTAAGRSATVTEARVMRHLRMPIQPDGKHPSKGFGFVMFTRTEDALTCLRKLNNNPDIFDKNNRPIVSFSIEDRTALNARKKRLEKSIANNPLNKQADGTQENRKRTFNGRDDSEGSNNKKGKFEKPFKGNVNKNAHNAPGQYIRAPTESMEYTGLTAKEGTQHKLRSKHKLRMQADVHKQNVKLEKKKSKKALRLKMQAKERIKQPKMKINKNPKDKRQKTVSAKETKTFTDMVSKYKSKLVGNQGKVKEKWYE